MLADLPAPACPFLPWDDEALLGLEADVLSRPTYWPLREICQYSRGKFCRHEQHETATSQSRTWHGPQMVKWSVELRAL